MSSARERPPLRPVDGIVLLDKPSGLSSNDALQRVKRLYRAQKAGHTGSLDPLATGLLPICLGEATKLCGLLLDGDKHYEARVRVGTSTTTGDAEGEVVRSSDPAPLSEDRVRAALAAFRGPIQQVPPMYSALKRQGQALYELARAGQTVEREARPVVIHRLELLDFARDELRLDVICSKGTYIRTLAEDLLASLDQAAHLVGLRRLGAMPFAAPVAMYTLDALSDRAGADFESLDALLLPPVAGVAAWPRVSADAAEIERLARGQRLRLGAGGAAGECAVLDLAGRLRFLGRIDPGGVFHPERMFHAA